jgi:hypothetical protein
MSHSICIYVRVWLQEKVIRVTEKDIKRGSIFYDTWRLKWLKIIGKERNTGKVVHCSLLIISCFIPCGPVSRYTNPLSHIIVSTRFVYYFVVVEWSVVHGPLDPWNEGVTFETSVTTNQWHSVASQKTCILRNNAMKTSDFTQLL